MSQFLSRWRPYSILWRNEKSQRELLACQLGEFETQLRKHEELHERLDTEPDVFTIANCLAIATEKLKYGIKTEIKSCTHRLVHKKTAGKKFENSAVYRIGQAMKKKYRREMDYVYAVINEMERKLERTIRDLDDVRMIMDTLKKIREQEIDMELRIIPIEVNHHNVSVLQDHQGFRACTSRQKL